MLDTRELQQEQRRSEIEAQKPDADFDNLTVARETLKSLTDREEQLGKRALDQASNIDQAATAKAEQEIKERLEVSAKSSETSGAVSLNAGQADEVLIARNMVHAMGGDAEMVTNVAEQSWVYRRLGTETIVGEFQGLAPDLDSDIKPEEGSTAGPIGEKNGEPSLEPQAGLPIPEEKLDQPHLSPEQLEERIGKPAMDLLSDDEREKLKASDFVMQIDPKAFAQLEIDEQLESLRAEIARDARMKELEQSGRKILTLVNSARPDSEELLSGVAA